MRDEKWLFLKLDEIWDNHFSDVPQHNNVKIIWGRRAKNRLGSIKREKSTLNLRNSKHADSIITINSLFKDLNIPDYVIEATIAHELCHYAHGFNSPLERRFNNPHEGGVVHKEMAKRGLERVLKMQKAWLKENWRSYIEKNLPNSIKPRKVKRKIIIKWI